MKGNVREDLLLSRGCGERIRSVAAGDASAGHSRVDQIGAAAQLRSQRAYLFVDRIAASARSYRDLRPRSEQRAVHEVVMTAHRAPSQSPVATADVAQHGRHSQTLGGRALAAVR